MTFDCEACKEKFANRQRQSLGRHIKIVHEEHRYEYQECDEVFREKRAARNHVKAVHKGVVKFECDMCDLKLSYEGSVKNT